MLWWGVRSWFISERFLFFPISLLCLITASTANNGVSLKIMLGHTLVFVHRNYIYSWSPQTCADTIRKFLFDTPLPFIFFSRQRTNWTLPPRLASVWCWTSCLLPPTPPHKQPLPLTFFWITCVQLQVAYLEAKWSALQSFIMISVLNWNNVSAMCSHMHTHTNTRTRHNTTETWREKNRDETLKASLSFCPKDWFTAYLIRWKVTSKQIFSLIDQFSAAR